MCAYAEVTVAPRPDGRVAWAVDAWTPGEAQTPLDARLADYTRPAVAYLASLGGGIMFLPLR